MKRMRQFLRRFRIMLAVAGAAAVLLGATAYSRQITFYLAGIGMQPGRAAAMDRARARYPQAEYLDPAALFFDDHRGLITVCDLDNMNITKLTDVTAIGGRAIPTFASWHEARGETSLSILMLADNQSFICGLYYDYGTRNLDVPERQSEQQKYLNVMRAVLDPKLQAAKNADTQLR